MRQHSQFRRRSGQPEDGYILMTLLLTMALMAIAAGVIVSSITFDIKRDREEEMIHRGVQYSRAIRLYYKKFGRYPTKLEDLENTSQMRFLRKRYKDPLTGKDFKLLHFGEAKLAMNALGGQGIAGASTIGANGSLNGPGGLTQTSAFGGNTGFGANTNSTFGQNSAGTNQTSTGTPSATDGSSPDATDSNGTGTLNGNSGDALSKTTFGGPIVGVASLSKDRTIREFDHKTKYNEWQFVYDPTLDRGFLITTPYQPQLQMFGTGPANVNGPNSSGQNGTSGGFSNTFGNSPSPMQNNPGSATSSGFVNQPSSSSQ